MLAVIHFQPETLACPLLDWFVSEIKQVGLQVKGITKEYEVFGLSHAEVTAQALKVPILARLPIDASIAIRCNQGKVEECQMPEFEAVDEWIETVTPECQSPKMPA